jgi:hypothetical protein
MESQCSRFIESICHPSYNISPVPGSIQLVLASPDTQKAAQTFSTFPISKVPASPFLHQHTVRSGHKDSVT